MTRVQMTAGGRPPRPVVALHERSGSWARQLRARLADRPARWFETRSTADLLAATAGCSSPIVLIEAGADAAPALRDLARLVEAASSPLILFLDPKGRPEALRAAREFGATLAEPGGRTPPEVAELIGRWIGLAARSIAREGWTRPIPADPARESDEWIDEIVAEAAAAGSCSPPLDSDRIDQGLENDPEAPTRGDSAERGGVG